ncbi:hypothetical protein ILUMI_20573 [Ignelater luminosus]|uniref:Uncharacterized protein n=1 Tax=Ignelater luminosus TaxID=2038154 RepID=A0A8K0CG44_IGNLU|nr:hypothetical protein ILUMI_20573 [Ignelater luminosus]
MEQALKAISEKKMRWLLASKTYNVPCRTLRGKCYLGRHKPTFDMTLEEELMKHLKELEILFQQGEKVCWKGHSGHKSLEVLTFAKVNGQLPYAALRRFSLKANKHLLWAETAAVAYQLSND